jgi:hypothetical protein
MGTCKKSFSGKIPTVDIHADHGSFQDFDNRETSVNKNNDNNINLIGTLLTETESIFR